MQQPDKEGQIVAPDSSDRFGVSSSRAPGKNPGLTTCLTTSHETIQAWARQHGADPATGEATSSGPAVRHINDGGAGIRFNFPGFAPYRAISWEEWLNHFSGHKLAFVYEEEDAARVEAEAYARWMARGRPVGDPDTDWFDAQRDLHARGEGPPAGARYAIVPLSNVSQVTLQPSPPRS